MPPPPSASAAAPPDGDAGSLPGFASSSVAWPAMAARQLSEWDHALSVNRKNGKQKI